jgi:3-deoxy-manno-octulosonate cytidylyltransferase (CMP-KDO synthetase)
MTTVANTETPPTSTSAIAIIPARYASTRLPAKPLVDLLGKTMIQRVWEGASSARLVERVVVATDDERIASEVRRFGGDVVLTDAALPSGTDRIAAAYQHIQQRDGTSYDLVLNIQGDEPLLQAAAADRLVQALVDSPQADVATPVQRVQSPEELANPSFVTVATTFKDGFRRALYFSRSPIPFVRDVPLVQSASDYQHWIDRAAAMQEVFWKHIGIYAYRAPALVRFSALPSHPLEQLEQLEQLRLLADGAVFACVETPERFVAIDTPEDVEVVRGIIATLESSKIQKYKED